MYMSRDSLLPTQKKKGGRIPMSPDHALIGSPLLAYYANLNTIRRNQPSPPTQVAPTLTPARWPDEERDVHHPSTPPRARINTYTSTITNSTRSEEGKSLSRRTRMVLPPISSIKECNDITITTRYVHVSLKLSSRPGLPIFSTLIPRMIACTITKLIRSTRIPPCSLRFNLREPHHKDR